MRENFMKKQFCSSFVERCFGKIRQNHGVTLNLRIARRGEGHISSSGARVQASFAKRTVKNLLPYSPISLLPSKKAAFTKPSRGTSDSERRTIINGNRVFRFDCERCRLEDSEQRVNATAYSFYANCPKRGAAFTLAEVLITLGIIGVVAALTLPSVIEKHQKQVAVTRLKKAYSITAQLIRHSEVDNDQVMYWDANLNGKDFFNKYIKNYVKYTKEFTSAQLWKLAPRKLMNGNAYGGTTYNRTSNQVYHIMIADGMMLSFNYGSASNMWIGIDINGLKGPNQIGKDTFLFIFTTNYGLQPLGGDGTSSGWNYGVYNRTKILGGGQGCSKSGTGYWCAALIMHDGWQIVSDYPW